MRRKKYPQTLEEWRKALSGKPTYERVELLGCGRLKRAAEYGSVCELIVNYVIKNFNAVLATFGKGESDIIETVFQLQRLKGELERLTFFRALGFLKPADKCRLEEALSGAVEELTANFYKSDDATENADILYELAAVKRLTENHGEL